MSPLTVMNKQSTHAVSEADSPQVSGEDGMTHTPLPWKAIGSAVWHEGSVIAQCHWISGQVTAEESNDNAALIVRAVNSHAALVEALEKIANIKGEYAIGDTHAYCRDIARAALAAAAHDTKQQDADPNI